MSGIFTGPKVTDGGTPTYIANWSRQVQLIPWLPTAGGTSYWTLTECPVSGQLAINGRAIDMNIWVQSAWQQYGWVLDSTLPNGTFFSLVTYSPNPINMNRLVSPVDRNAFPVQPTIQIGF